MISAPIPPDEPQRLAALDALAILDTPREQAFDDIAELASAVCQTPVALVSLIDGTRQWFKARVGLDATETARELAFCAHAILDVQPLEVPDARQDVRFHDNPLVTSEPFVRFYAGAPLVMSTGERLGTLCVIDHEPRRLAATQIRALEILAGQVVAQLELRRTSAVAGQAHTALQTAHDELQRLVAEDRFRLLSEAAPIGIYETDVEGRCLYTNPAWQEIAGLTFDEALGHGWVRAIHPDDRAHALEQWQSAVDEQREFSSIFRFRTPAGVTRDIDSRARAIVSREGVVTGYVGTASDVTLRRSAEEVVRASQQQLQRVLDGSSDGFWDWNVGTGEVEFSRRWAEMLGYELQEIEPHVRAWETLVHPDDVPFVTAELQSHFAGRTPYYQTEHRMRTKTGAWKWILDRGKVTARAADGTPLRMAGTHSDIDARKRAEMALDRFFGSSLELLCITGFDGRFKRINPPLQQAFGYTRERILSTPFLEFLHPDDRKRAVEEMKRLATGRITTRFEARVVAADGTTRWIAWTATPDVDEQLVYSAGRDITDERAAAQALAESENRYRDLFEHATDMIQAVDPQGRLLYVNRAWLDRLGYTAAEARSLTLFDVIHPEGWEHCQDLLHRVMAGEKMPKIVTEFRTRSGERRTVEGTVNCRFENGLPISTRGIFRDVTEQKKAEEEVRASEAALRSIIRSSLSGIITFDQDGRIESVNPSAERILGYASGDLVGEAIDILLPQPPADLDSFQRDAINRSLGRVTEWEVQRSDGRLAQIEVSLFEFDTSKGRQIAANIQDISQRREVERLKREFVSTISHELRTPLTSIRGSLDLLEGNVFGELAPAAHEVVTIALRNTTRLIDLINDILDLDRLDSGKFELRVEAVGVDAIFRGAIDSVRGVAEQNGILIERAVSDAAVIADSHRMTQVVVNLLSNAVKFSRPGSTVRVSATKEGPTVRIDVQDHGRGIPQEYVDRIFDRFQQVEASDSRTKGGSGLGLAISRAIVEQHRGTIGVESVEGRGSTFWIRLPSAPAGRDCKPSADRVIGAWMSDSASAAALQEALRDGAAPVIPFTTVEQVLEAFRSDTLSALIVELDRDGDGIELLARVRSSDARGETPIIVLTDSHSRIDRFDDNLTIFLSAGDHDALVEAIRKVGSDAAGNDVLIVEDDEPLLLLLRRQLERDGIRVRTAATGGAAVAMIRKALPKLVVLDIGLPDIDGFDVVSVLRRDDRLRRLPLLVYSGLDLGNDERERLQLGPTRFLTKATSDDRTFRSVVLELIRWTTTETLP